MNFISHEKAYSLFPRASFEDYHAAILKESGLVPRKTRAALQKYAARGWTMFGIYEDVSHLSELSEGSRWIGDRSTWTVPLFPKLPKLPPDCCESNGFYFQQATHPAEDELPSDSDGIYLPEGTRARSIVFSLCYPSEQFKRTYGFDLKQCITAPLSDDESHSKQDQDIVSEALEHTATIVQKQRADRELWYVQNTPLLTACC